MNMMQCDTIKKKDMTGQTFIEWTQQTSSKGKRVGAAIRESIQFNLAWSVSFKKHNQTYLEKLSKGISKKEQL
jgi:hypothetical protein